MKKFWKYMPLLALMVTTSLLAGCGVKPSRLDPPAGSENKTFPKTYPAPDSK